LNIDAPIDLMPPVDYTLLYRCLVNVIIVSQDLSGRRKQPRWVSGMPILKIRLSKRFMRIQANVNNSLPWFNESVLKKDTAAY